MTGKEGQAELFLATVEALVRHALPWSGRMPAGLLAAAHLDLASDSRSFAKTFGLAHALTLRAMGEAAELGLIDVTRRDARTPRGFWTLTPAGRALAEAATSGIVARRDVAAQDPNGITASASGVSSEGWPSLK